MIGGEEMLRKYTPPVYRGGGGEWNQKLISSVQESIFLLEKTEFCIILLKIGIVG